jgi:1-deoxy-D-xylulose-5-phosphate synthase
MTDAPDRDPSDLAPHAPSLLELVDEPADLRRLPAAQLRPLAQELRDYLITSVSRSGGHFAAGLGVVELTIALHYVYDTPRDAIVWDVGHQCYPHKILTGRRHRLGTIRRRGGLSGFLKRDESEHDAFGAGHSSTSISAALGIAVAEARAGTGSRSVAVIGDGALTAGLAYEAMHHAGAVGANLLVVLNDNGMSISPNVGAVSDILARLRSGTPAPNDPAPGQCFAEVGFTYHGPVDGHDLEALVAALREMRSLEGPHLLHVVTQKGHGYAPAVADPIKYHGVTPFDPQQGIVPGAKSQPTYTQVFGDWLCEAAARDERIVAITPAMREGSGLVEFSQRFPDRYFDVGIAEQHAVTFAAGLAARGLRPVVAIYSTFLQRAYDQLIHDVTLQKLPVLFAIDRAGLVGPDGATHNGNLDLSYLRCIPGLVVMAPSDGDELRDMLHTGLVHDGPVAVRYPRANVPPMTRRPPETLPIGLGEVRRTGEGCAILAFGTVLHPALEAGEMLGATVANMRSVKPLDEELVLELARTHELLVTVEENATAGGAGAAVGECLALHGASSRLLHLGLPDRHGEHGTREECLRDAGLDAQGLFDAVSARLGRDGLPRHLGMLGAGAAHHDGGRAAAVRSLGRVLQR